MRTPQSLGDNLQAKGYSVKYSIEQNWVSFEFKGEEVLYLEDWRAEGLIERARDMRHEGRVDTVATALLALYPQYN